MSTITPTQTRLLRELAGSCNDGRLGLIRCRGGYHSGRKDAEVFTMRTALAAEREGLVQFRGSFRESMHLTDEGRAAAARAIARGARQAASEQEVHHAAR